MRIVTAEQMRNIDGKTIQEIGIPSMVLMENAALAVVGEIKKMLSQDRKQPIRGQKAVLLVGKGNNGGDGLAIARHLNILGIESTVFLLANPSDLQGDALTNHRLFQNIGGKVVVVEDERQIRLFKLALMQSQIAVDALFGTGFNGEISTLTASFIDELNKAEVPVICVDIASGIEANTGKMSTTAVRGDVTVTFGLAKLGHYLDEGSLHTGKLIVDPISIPDSVIDDEKIFAYLLTNDIIKPLIPKRHPHGHKGSHGLGVIIGGSIGMSGAVQLAGKAAQRCGIGMLQIVVPEGIADIVDAGVLEATVWPAKDFEMLTGEAWSIIQKRLARADACAVGPGMKQPDSFLAVLKNILQQTDLPVVLDADALNLISREEELLTLRHGRGNLILTPHPGEMARLCGCSVAEVRKNRLELAMAKALEWGTILVLKGASTIVASPDGRVFVNPTGNAGLGSGGTGDVLTGCILAWLAQGVPPLGAACLGVYLHGKAGDELEKRYGLSGYTASEVADILPLLRKEIEQ